MKHGGCPTLSFFEGGSCNVEQVKRKPRSTVRLCLISTTRNINPCRQPPVPLKLNLQRTLLPSPVRTRVAVKTQKLIAVPAVPRRFHHASP